MGGSATLVGQGPRICARTPTGGGVGHAAPRCRGNGRIEESLAAAEWAAQEALRRGLPLHLVHAWEGGTAPDPSELPELDAPRDRARRTLRGAVERLGERFPQIVPTIEQMAGSAPDALVEAGEKAELLVLGSRAFSGFGGFMAARSHWRQSPM